MEINAALESDLGSALPTTTMTVTSPAGASASCVSKSASNPATTTIYLPTLQEGVSAATAAGIGVGVGIPLLLALLGTLALLFRERRKNKTLVHQHAADPLGASRLSQPYEKDGRPTLPHEKYGRPVQAYGELDTGTLTRQSQ